MSFFIGLALGNLVGFFLNGLFSANKIDESWHNGFRAGRYGKNI